MDSPSGGTALTIQVSGPARYVVVTLSGEIDFNGHSRLRDELTQALATTRVALIVDLTEVGFCDSSGVNTFVRIARRARERGVSLVLAGMHGRVANVFVILGLGQVFHTHEDVEAAVRWLESAEEGTVS
jgi:anti-anti-sigma factor